MSELDAFRHEVRGWIAANLTPELREAARRATSVFLDPQHTLAWQRKLHAKGWAAPHWPVEHGGTAWSEAQRYIFASESAAAGAPGLAPMGLRMVAPVIMHYGAEAQKAFYLPRILSGEDYWCQGYSEPQAGSDLAALQLRADKAPAPAEAGGGDYILNGSKIWTTHAHFANRMFCLVRTAREERPQQGITFLLLDMDTPGITVRPIRSLADDHDFNEVFFDDVRVPQSGRLGDEGQGWTVAKALLVFERSTAYADALRVSLARLTETAQGAGAISEPSLRRRVAILTAQIEAIGATETRIMAGGPQAGAGPSMLKIQGTEAAQALQELAVEVAGDYAAVNQFEARQPGSNVEPIGPPHALTATAAYLNGRAASIYAGSNEIQRNIIAKLALGL